MTIDRFPGRYNTYWLDSENRMKYPTYGGKGCAVFPGTKGAS